MPTDERDINTSYCGSGGFTGRNASSSGGLLCNFEESALNGRLNLITALDGFHLQIGKLLFSSFFAKFKLHGCLDLVTSHE